MDQLVKPTEFQRYLVSNFFFKKERENNNKSKFKNLKLRYGEDELGIEHGNTQVLNHAAMKEEEEGK